MGVRVHVARMGSAVKFTFVRACVCMGVRGPPCACACVCVWFLYSYPFS